MKRILIIFSCFCNISCLTNDPAVIVVGAGAAGIAAATRLLEKGLKNVKILEAESRIGGRINSIKFGDAFVDLGAQWCHGENDNIVFSLVKDYHVLRHTETSKKFYLPSGRSVDDKFSRELFDIMDLVYSADGNRHVPKYITVGDYCIKNFNRTVHEKFGHNPEKLKLALSTITYFHHRVLGYEGSFSWFEPAAKNDYRDCGGDLQLNWNGLGYKTILDVLMKKFPNNKRQLPIDERILLNKEVERIIWNEKLSRKSVTVICSDGSAFSADHVILTPSIGVLKEKASTMFQPQLSHDKYRVIRDIGFGAVMKVAMYFPRKWWKDATGFNFVWTQQSIWSVLSDLPNDPSLAGRSWVTYLYAVETTEGSPNVLIAWFTGNFIPVIEQLSDDVLAKGIIYVFRKFLGREFGVIYQPDRIIRSQWYSNPHFRGSYSFQTVNCERGNGTTSENKLAIPLVNVDNIPIVQFAGEATHPYYFSTVHGAIETGFREADILIGLYTKYA